MDITSEYGSDLNANEIAWVLPNSGRTTYAVKGKLPNAWGLYDMSGNVSEWTWDWYDDGYSGSGRRPYRTRLRLLPCQRGGGWYHEWARYVRVAFVTAARQATAITT